MSDDDLYRRAFFSLWYAVLWNEGVDFTSQCEDSTSVWFQEFGQEFDVSYKELRKLELEYLELAKKSKEITSVGVNFKTED